MTKQLSQTALYGELQTSIQQYRNEIKQFPDLTQEEEQSLLEHARAGDMQARNKIIESCLDYVSYWAGRCYYATYWQSWRIEYEELIAVGNSALVEHFEKALVADVPMAYLKGVAKLEIKRYSQYHRSLIVTPDHGMCETLPVESLDIPFSSDNEGTLADLIEDVSSQKRDEKCFSALYQALEALTEKQKQVVKRLYGLDECASELLAEVAGKSVSIQSVHQTKDDAFIKLCVLMPSPTACHETCTLAQACEKLGVKKHIFDYTAQKYGVKPVFTNLYLCKDVEYLQEMRDQMYKSRTHRKCEYCGNSFLPEKLSQKYDTQKCKENAKYQRKKQEKLKTA